RRLLRDGFDGDARRALERKAVYAGRDCRKGDRLQPMLAGEAQAFAVAGRQELVLAGAAAVPDGAHRMNHVARLEAEAGCDPRAARRTAAELGAGPGKLRPGCAMDRAANAAAGREGAVRRVD